MPYSGCSDTHTLFKIQAGEKPERLSDRVTDPVWEFLEKCWSGDPKERPTTADVFDAFSRFCSIPQAVRAPEGPSAREELPGKLKLRVQGVKVLLNKPKQQRFSIRFRYGDKAHATSPTDTMAGGEHTWFVLPLPLPSSTSPSFKQEWSGNLVDRNQ